MSDRAPAVAAEAAPPATKSKYTALIVALVATVAGAGAGTFVVAPMVVKGTATTAHADTAAAGGEHKAGEQPIHLMENIVLNPAGTGGTRFLMCAVAIETGSTVDNDKMNKRDSELRDVIQGIIGSRTIDQLATLKEREPLKREIIDSVTAMFGPKSARSVYFPQFVIQ